MVIRADYLPVKKLVLILVCAGVGYYVYTKWFLSEPATETAPTQAYPPSKPVSLTVKRSVRSLFEEWKGRKLIVEGKHTTGIVPEKEVSNIRQQLFSEGIYTDQAVNAVVTKALLEIGVSGNEANEVASGLLSLRSIDGKNEKNSANQRTGAVQ